MRSRTRAIIALGGSLLLAACGHSPPTQLFVLNVQNPAVRTAYAGPPIQVRSLHLPPQFDRPEIVSDAASGQLKARAFAHWAAPVGELAQSTLTGDLSARLPDGKVIYPDAPAPSGAVLVSVDILDARIAGGAGVAQASWSITTPASNPKLPSTVVTHTASLSVDGRGAGPAGDADALGRLLGVLADRMVAKL